MTHPFGPQTVAKAKYKRSFLAKNSFAWPPPMEQWFQAWWYFAEQSEGYFSVQWI